MEVIDDNKTETPNQNNLFYEEWEKSHRRGRIIGGLLFLAAGSLFLLREVGLAIPQWVFTWKMLLIAVGLFTGIKHGFRRGGWLIMMLIGGAFLAQDFYPAFTIGKFIWPLMIMFIGIRLILKPRHRFGHFRKHKMYRDQWQQGFHQWNEKKKHGEQLELNTVFGSIKKNIINKNFGGGEINTVFGGCEINLMNADFEGVAELEVNLVFGGVTLIMPNDWAIRSEVVSVMGSVEDTRTIQAELQGQSNRVLVLRGNAVMGGIEIKSIA
jgi:predicted membrane protein